MNLKSSVVLAVLATLLILISCDSSGPPASAGLVAPVASSPTLWFSAIPDQSTTELEEKLAPLAKYLSKQLGVEVEYVPSRDYQATVEMFKNGDVDLGWFGGLTGVQARRAVPGARAIAQGVDDLEYHSYFIANQSTGLERGDEFPVEIASLRFTFGSESSTSGRLMPEYFLRHFTGKSPEEFFTLPVGFSGSHDKTIELVESGQYEAGVVNFKVYEQQVAMGEVDPEVVRILWESPPYADYNWTVRGDLDQRFGPRFTQRLQATLVAIDDPALLVALPRGRLIPASNQDYEEIQQVARDLKMLR